MQIIWYTHPVHPDTKTQSPSTTAREYPIKASKVEPDEMSLRSDIFSKFVYFG